MTETLHAHHLLRRGHGRPTTDRIVLDYEARFLRRKRLMTEAGLAVLVDLAETVSLESGDALELESGALIEIEAAQEPVLVITGELSRLAWHIGNRHTPCQIEAGRLLIRRDPVLADMLAHLGAAVVAAVEPFTPEGGAYGHGRTMGHDHGPGDHAHSHSHDHGHSHGHVHHHGGHSHGHDEEDGEAEEAL